MVETVLSPSATIQHDCLAACCAPEAVQNEESAGVFPRRRWGPGCRGDLGVNRDLTEHWLAARAWLPMVFSSPFPVPRTCDVCWVWWSRGFFEGLWFLAHAVLECFIFCSHCTESLSIFEANCVSLLDLQGIKCHNMMTFGMGSWKLIFSSTHSCRQAKLLGTPWNFAVPGEETCSPLLDFRDLGLGRDGQRVLTPSCLPCSPGTVWRQPYGAVPGFYPAGTRSWKTGRAGSVQLLGVPHLGVRRGREGAPQHHLKAPQLSSITIPVKQQSLLVSIFGLKSNSLGDVPIKWISWLNTSWLSGVYLTHSN